jgi:transcriptional regulator GlxA family with amidase domain
MTSQTRTVGIYLFDEMEILDFAGPYEVFSTASRVKQKLQPGSLPPFHVITLADSQRTVTARAGLKVLPDYAIVDHLPIDVLIIPGGVVTAELQRPQMLNWIQTASQQTTITASVCTGAFLLAAAGLLYQQGATTHWEDMEELRVMFPNVNVQPDKPWVDNGSTVTSAGISAGIGMSLHLVERLESRELAIKTARKMEYDWKPG